MISVTTFNLLSTNYCDYVSRPLASGTAVDPKKRWDELKMLLLNCFNTQDIICLQEVCEFFRTRLHVLCFEHNYEFICRNYDGPWSGYMGVAILFPRNNFKLTQVEFIRPNRLVRKYFEEPVSYKPGWLASWFFREDNQDEWFGKMSKKSNVMLTITLEKDSVPFKVVNYHAPCVYFDDNMSLISAAIFAKTINDTKGDRVLVCTDLNIQPLTLAYELITSDISQFSEMINNKIIRDGLIKMNLTPISSTYDNFVNRDQLESMITCETASYTRGQLNEFEGCLDYIFHRGCLPLSVSMLPTLNVEMPNDNWPSDHKMITAKFDLA